MDQLNIPDANMNKLDVCEEDARMVIFRSVETEPTDNEVWTLRRVESGRRC